MKIINIPLVILCLILGIIIGGYLFSDSRPRSVLNLHGCSDKCFKQNEITGLLASVGMAKFYDFKSQVVSVVMETDKTLVINHPQAAYPIHYVVIPKKDIKNIADITEEDKEYLVDAFAVIENLIKEKNISDDYKVITNGPGYQSVSYLHFHLVAR